MNFFIMTILAVLPFTYAENVNNTFFNVKIYDTLSGFKNLNKEIIKECKEHKQPIRLQSEIDWKYNHSEDSPDFLVVECTLTEQMSAYFLGDADKQLWKITKYGLDKSVTKVTKDLANKVNKPVNLKSEAINDGMGKQYTFLVPYSDGEIRGSALEPYMKVSPDALSMKDGSVEYVRTKPLIVILNRIKTKSQDVKKAEIKQMNSGNSGL